MTIFKGHNESELADAWKLFYEDEHECREALRKELHILRDAAERGRDRRFEASELRNFLSALAKEEAKTGFRAPLFEGLSNVTHDATLFQYTLLLLGEMWT